MGVVAIEEGLEHMTGAVSTTRDGAGVCAGRVEAACVWRAMRGLVALIQNSHECKHCFQLRACQRVLFDVQRDAWSDGIEERLLSESKQP